MIVGIVLAAGSATRFGGDKLRAELDTGRCVAAVTCARLKPAVDRLIAVVRPAADALAARLIDAGAEVRFCPDAAAGMGNSLAYGVAQAADAAGWLIALGDMPFIASADAERVAAALRGGDAIAVPVALGRRGHPVGFARRFFAELTALNGDSGARSVLVRHPDDIVEIPVDDALTWRDIDTVADLEQAKLAFRKAS